VRPRSGSRKPSTRKQRTRIRIRGLAIGLAVVLAIAATAAIPSHASRTRKCKAVSAPQVVGGVAVGATLHAHHGRWVCEAR
jgi:hypothetical protein